MTTRTVLLVVGGVESWAKAMGTSGVIWRSATTAGRVSE